MRFEAQAYNDGTEWEIYDNQEDHQVCTGEKIWMLVIAEALNKHAKPLETKQPEGHKSIM